MVGVIRPCVFTDEVGPDFRRAVELASKSGVHDIEVRGGVFGKTITEVNEEDVQQMVAVLDRYDAQIACFATPVGKCDLDNDAEWEQHLRYLRKMSRLSRYFGTNLVRCFAFWVPEERRRRGQRNLSLRLPDIVARLRRAVLLAEDLDLVLGLETEDTTYVGTCQEARMVVEALGSPRVLICWDVYNAWSCGEPIFPDASEHVRGKAVHLHLKDAVRDKYGRPLLTTVGRGQLPYKEVFTRLRQEGFEGAASVETHWDFFSAKEKQKVNQEQATLNGIRHLVKLLSIVP